MKAAGLSPASINRAIAAVNAALREAAKAEFGPGPVLVKTLKARAYRDTKGPGLGTQALFVVATNRKRGQAMISIALCGPVRARSAPTSDRTDRGTAPSRRLLSAATATWRGRRLPASSRSSIGERSVGFECEVDGAGWHGRGGHLGAAGLRSDWDEPKLRALEDLVAAVEQARAQAETLAAQLKACEDRSV